MEPWATCYQQAWPLQLDLQIYLLVPWIAMIFWKWPKLGMTISTLLVLANMVINIVIADRYDLKIGWVDVDQYYILLALLSKPWTKLYCVGFGALMAFFYFNVRRYREIENLRERSLKFRRINHLMTSKRLGKAFLISGLLLIAYQITQLSSYFENP
jgi:peptidoglycan/LPS O-acetylase OafA/YrhL